MLFGYAADISAHIEPASQTVDVGDTAVFRCLVSGPNSGTVNTVWYKDGHPIVTGDDSRISNVVSAAGNELILQVTTVKRTDAGMYQCTVVNDNDNTQASSRLIIGGLLIVLSSGFLFRYFQFTFYVVLFCLKTVKCYSKCSICEVSSLL